MSKFKHGTMETTGQQKTFDGFVGIVGKSIVVILLFLLFLAMIDG